MNWLLLVLIVGLYIAFARAVFQFWPTPRSRTPADRFLSGAMSRDDERCWLAGGFLYSNPDDPALVVPNRYYVGWTVNLGHPGAKLVVVLLVGLLLVPVVLAIVVPGLPRSGCHSFGCLP
jgi:uncharacterized membrane protein